MRWPLLQLLHLSDLHWAPDDVSEVPVRGFVDKVMRLAYGHVSLELRQGLAGHDPIAIDDFEESVVDAVDNSEGWRERTWLVVTGDLSTWGDDESVRQALSFVANTAGRLGVGWTAIYGNHDVWPGRYPRHPLHCLLGPQELDDRRTSLRRDFFPQDWPVLPLTEGLGSPGGLPLAVRFRHRPGRLVCYSLNTIVHNPAWNVVALGHVANDRYWQHGADRRPQLDLLGAQWQADDVGIVLLHHPVHDPWASDPADRWKDVLVNHEAVSAELAVERRAPIVLAGHTHRLFPKEGELPGNAPRGMALHPPLRDGQTQLIVGTLAQSTLLHAGAQSWQRLRFFEDEAPTLVLERVVHARRRGQTGFESGLPQEMRF
jgi:3',5'-cyclic AMP phosphodiesterase CpdA